jgi:hypothetical protein
VPVHHLGETGDLVRRHWHTQGADITQFPDEVAADAANDSEALRRRPLITSASAMPSSAKVQ